MAISVSGAPVIAIVIAPKEFATCTALTVSLVAFKEHSTTMVLSSTEAGRV